MADRPSLHVLGLGLIGGSLLRAAAATHDVSGWSPSADTRDAAAADGFRVVADPETLLEEADAADGLVVLAAPVTAFGDLLRRVDAVAPEVRLTDVGSVKAAVEDQVEALAPTARFIGSHPMAGTQHSGWAAGSADLFTGAAWVTTLTEESDLDTWMYVADLALGLQCRVVPTEAPAHDSAVALVSHLPHLLALALAQVGADGGPLALSLAAGSFGDGTRVAATRPELIRAMCETNKKALVPAVDAFLGVLGVGRGSLASTGSLVKLTEAGHAGRMQFEQRGGGLELLTLSGDDLIEQLLSVGASGGHVTAVRREGDDGPEVDAYYPAYDDD
ncbi:prephenate dehydrogenase [Nakamurella sp. YIM 132087]|uniref:Prephenate dehydrogenase n=1 Tax=Nakamurella alba TaxID=2665158 RepID=A0A7K1FRL3_9ACTN|nr:prephenate dehydrogenase [Nakamurella alba]MTD15444.1 prephenate dehydrogenase [Nakamurella alba]